MTSSTLHRNWLSLEMLCKEEKKEGQLGDKNLEEKSGKIKNAMHPILTNPGMKL